MKNLLWIASVAAFSITSASALADDEPATVFNYLTNNLTIPSSARVPAAFRLPAVPVEALLAESPTTSTNFLAGGYCGTWPPDTMGAVGTNRIIVMSNCRVQIEDRGGTVLTNSLLNAWWGAPSTTAIWDQHVTYDPYRDRWIACAGRGPSGSTNTSLMVGVSASADPSGAWYRYRYPATGPRSLDFPLLGFNKDKIVVTFTSLGASFNNAVVVVFDKETLYSGTEPVLGSTYSWKELSSDLGLNLAPAITYDTNLSSLYLVQTANSAQGRLALYEISGTAAAPTITTNGYPTNALGSGWAASGSRDAYGDFAPQTNTSQLIDAGDDRMLSVVYRNGALWCAHTIFLPAVSPTYSTVQWWKLNPSNANTIESGRLTSSLLYSAYPSIAVNRFNDALIGYSTFSSNQYASANYSLKACTNRVGTFQTPALLKAGEGTYSLWTPSAPRNRWGDYSATMVDPVNDSDFWTIQEYAASNTHSGTITYSYWGTWWGRIDLPLPANDNFSNAYVISGAQGSTNGSSVRSSREIGEPSHGGNADTASVWYSWTAPADGDVSFTAADSIPIFDTVIAVYTGSSVGSLTAVTNDHSRTTISIAFHATSNSVYRVAIAGLNGACGEFVLSWSQPSAPMFTLNPHGRDVFMGSNVTFTAMAIGVPSPAYQWLFNGTNIGAATASSFTTNNVSTNTTGNFTVIATNSSGSATSTVAHLEVYSTQRALMSDFTYLTNGFRSVISGITGSAYVVQTSTNLINWSPIETNQVTFTNIDQTATNFPSRFYRVLFVP